MPHSFRLTLFVLPWSHCKERNISILTLLLPHLPYQMLTSDVPRPPLPSKPWILFSDIHLFPKKNKLQVYTQIFQALLHGSESQVYSPAQITKIDSLHYKALRQIFKIKSPFYHRVILPSDSPCSNEFLLSLSYPVLSSCIPSSLRISDSRLKYLAHILRHPSSPESVCSTHHIHFVLSPPPGS